ncbi:hypothetical protein [Aestuariivirga litoralis]|uniref:hypothetical protein n=1 Tax=Aestuariivirga litoralis TaxID=2650924 RepID=UPI0018C82FB7|nr:hypothetical protein [Aestuariivirga litoralis]MBG1233639.1 hypothetical protein [Aestuariivirga litoralis]
MRDQFPLATGFIISCPVSDKTGSPVREIRSRGNIPLVLQEDVLIELKRSDLLESWRSACNIGRQKAQALMASAANRIAGALEDEDTCDIGALAEDMTAFFLLAVREKGMDVAQAARSCTLAWREDTAEHLSVSRY